MAVVAVDVFEADVFEDAIYADFTSDYVDRLDILQKIVFIKLDVLSFHPVDDIYPEVRSIRRVDESVRVMDNPVSAQGNDPAGSNFTPKWVVLNGGWRIGIEFPSDWVLSVLGEMISDDGFAGAQLVKPEYLPDGVSALVNYTPPSSEVISVATPVNVVTGDLSEVTDLVKYLPQAVHINADVPVNGDGSARQPFDNIGDALNFAEQTGLTAIYVYSDVGADRNFKNFVVIGVGNPKIDCNGHNLDKSEFEGVRLHGAYTGTIVARDCGLENNLSGLQGKFYRCGLGGDLFCADGSDVEMVDPYSSIEGSGRPSVSVTSLSGTTLGVRGMRGGFLLEGCDHAASLVSIDMLVGALTLAASCTNGTIVARGSCDYADDSAGSVVVDRGLIPEQVWKGIQI